MAIGAASKNKIVDGNKVAFRVSAVSTTIGNNIIRGPMKRCGIANATGADYP
jgi:hypothetical protein